MCTIAILFGVADSPLVIAANRDELYARPTRPPERLSAPGESANPRIVGGVDVVSGGTWLAIHRSGRFVAVTNQRALAPPTGLLRSRGLAVKELAAAIDPDAYVAALDPRAYASMNLVWGDADRVSIAYLRQDAGTREVVALAPGIHVLCNDRLGSPGYPRAARLEHAIRRDHERALPIALADHTLYDPPTPIPSHLTPELARALTATCIHTPHYGTRSSTIAGFARGTVTHYAHADGPPCTTPYRDLRELLA